jgi:hypothetical protein
MTVQDLLARIAEYGGSVTLENGQLNLVKPFDPYWRAKIVKDLLPLLVEHKSGLLLHFRGSSEDDDPGELCRGCGMRVWLGGGITAADVGLGCARVRCPYRERGGR